MDRKRITVPSREQVAISELLAGESGAEFRVLEVLAQSVLSGLPISVDFQAVANVVMAKAFVAGKLPAMKRGRPISFGQSIGWNVAYYYYQLRDGGMSYADAVSKVSERFHKDERHIMRLVNANKSQIGGDDREARSLKRELWERYVEIYRQQKAEGGKSYFDFVLETLSEAKASEPDPLEVFDSMLQQLLSQYPTDKK